MCCADGGPLANDGYFSGFRLNSLRAVPPVTGRISPAFRANFHDLGGLEAQIDSSHANDGALNGCSREARKYGRHRLRNQIDSETCFLKTDSDGTKT